MNRFLTIFVIAAMALSFAHSERRRDPLTQAEVDQLRDQAQEPDLRLKLYVQFARNRIEGVEKAGSDSKAADRGTKIRDALQDFLDVYDELDQNIDTFEDRGADFRKALKSIIEADVEFQANLRAIQAAAEPKPEESRVYEFLLQSALDTVDSSTKDHRDLLTEQEDRAKHKKKNH